MAAERIDVATAREMWKAGDLFVDVRDPDEYARGHVSGAVNIPLGKLPGVVHDLPEGQVITLCSMGGRAARAAAQLDAMGRTAFSIEGGTKAWAAAGLPVAVGPASGKRKG
jgi:rhodanese-related sulfurtransferase